MNTYQIIPYMGDQYLLGELYGEDIRSEWIVTTLRKEGIRCETESVFVQTEPARASWPNNGTKVPARETNGRVRLLVAPENKERAIEVFNRAMVV